MALGSLNSERPNRSGYVPIPSGSSTERTSSTTTLYRRWLEGEYTIVPQDSFFIDVWDMTMLTAMFAASILLPFEVGVLATVPHALRVIDAVIDAIFVLDIFLTFNVAIVEQDVSNPNNPDTIEKRPKKIAAHYMAFPLSKNMMAGWFWPDVFTVVPWDSCVYTGALRHGRLIRILRLLRMSFASVKLLTCSCVTLLLTHWLACLWANMGMHPDPSRGSWLTNHLSAGRTADELSGFKVYTEALYFCTVVLTTVGFGDVLPRNDTEVLAMIATIFLTGVIWAWVVANVVAIISNMDPFGTKFNKIMDDLNALMGTYEVQKPLQMKVRRHINEAFNVQRIKYHKEAIHWLSEGLQGELAISLGMDKVCDRVWYFRGASTAVVIELADEFKGDLFGPGETIADHNSLMVVMRGSCINRGRLISRDGVLGEDIILSSEHLRELSTPRTLNYMEVVKLHRDRLSEAAKNHPDFSRRLRRAQIKLALWRSFILQAEKIRAQKGVQKNSQCYATWDQMYFDTNDEPRTNEVSQKFTWMRWEESMNDAVQLGSEETVQQVRDAVQKLREAAATRSTCIEERLGSLAKRVTAIEGTTDSAMKHLRVLSKGEDHFARSLSGASPTAGRSSPKARSRLWDTM